MRVLAYRDGLFGPVRIMERQVDKARLYCIKGSVQTMTRDGGVSLFGYVHAAKLLVRDARRVLVIGGAGGSLATMLARQGQQVTVIDVDPCAEALSRAYFDLDPRVEWRTADALAVLSANADQFDAVVIDACTADGLAAPFDGADILAQILDNACPDGSLVLNLVHKDGAPAYGAALAEELIRRGFAATLYRSEEGWEGNELLHVRKSGSTDTLKVTDLQRRPAETRTYLMSLRAYAPSGRR